MLPSPVLSSTQGLRLPVVLVLVRNGVTVHATNCYNPCVWDDKRVQPSITASVISGNYHYGKLFGFQVCNLMLLSVT
jgi:hypothetical protein